MIPAVDQMRGQFFFQQGRFEWSETYYMNTSDYGNALLQMRQLAVRRVRLLGQGVELHLIRVSRDTVFRDSAFATDFQKWQIPADVQDGFNPPDPGNQLYRKLAPASISYWASAPPAVCVRVLCVSGPLYRKVLFLSGIPSAIAEYGPVFGEPIENPNDIPGGWFGPFQDFVNFMITAPIGHIGPGPFGFPASVPKTPPGKVPIRGITRSVLPAGPLTITLDSVANINVGDTVELFRPQMATGSIIVKGRHEVLAVAAGPPATVTVEYAQEGIPIYSRGGLLWVVLRAYQSMTNAILDGVNEHRRGFATQAIRGRSRPPRRYVT